MSVKMRIVWAEEVAKKLQRLASHDLKQVRDKRLKESAILVEGEAKKEAPVDTGLLRKQIKSQVRGDHAVVFNHIAYAFFVHEGTKSHVIKAKNKRSLSWGAGLFATSVQHPWTRANPFFERAKENSQDKIRERLSHLITALVNE